MNKKLNSYEIIGGNKLFGEIVNQTSKNATLPILSASLLSNDKVYIYNVPKITDVINMLKILKRVGVLVRNMGEYIYLNPQTANNTVLDYELSRSMRSSLFLLGSMLQRFKEVDLTLPGGCKIGKRPIDIHINAFRKMGVEVQEFENHTYFKVKKAHSAKIRLRIPSVGATENIVQFACKLKGKTTIYNAAREPEVVDLCNFLNQMGAKILGAGTKKITIYGVDKLHSTKYKPIGDRIVAGTIMCAVAICGGEVKIKNAVPYQNLKLIEILRKIGCQIDYKDDIIKISRSSELTAINRVKTGYYPKFPTDLQSFMVAVSCIAKGKTTIQENIFENRFLIVPEIQKMGAKIKQISQNTVKINGINEIMGTVIEAKDLRGGASLVLMGLAGTGKTVVENVHFIDRGYENLENIFKNLGANIKRI